MDWQNSAELADIGLAMDWHRIGDGLAPDWHWVGTRLAKDRLSRITMDWQQIGIDWRWIGTGLVLDWRRIV